MRPFCSGPLSISTSLGIWSKGFWWNMPYQSSISFMAFQHNVHMLCVCCAYGSAFILLPSYLRRLAIEWLRTAITNWWTTMVTEQAITNWWTTSRFGIRFSKFIKLHVRYKFMTTMMSQTNLFLFWISILKKEKLQYSKFCVII